MPSLDGRSAAGRSGVEKEQREREAGGFPQIMGRTHFQEWSLPQAVEDESRKHQEEAAEEGVRMTRHNSILFPWELWLSSKHPIAAVAGKDFHQTPRGFVTMLRREARRIGLKVHAKYFGDEVWFRFGGKK